MLRDVPEKRATIWCLHGIQRRDVIRTRPCLTHGSALRTAHKLVFFRRLLNVAGLHDFI